MLQQASYEGARTVLVTAGYTSRWAQRLSLSNTTITKVSFYLSKNGSPTGLAYARIRRVSDDSVLAQASIDVSSLTTGFAWYNLSLGPVTINEEVRVTFEFAGGDTSNYLQVGQANTDVVSGVLSGYSTLWTDYSNQDITFKLWASGSSGSVTTSSSESILLQQASYESARTVLVTAGYTSRWAQRLSLSNTTITKVSFYLSKNGSPTGVAYARIRRVSDDGVLAQASIDVSTITTGFAWYDFSLGPVTINEEVRVAFEFAGGDTSNYLQVGQANTDVASGVLSGYSTLWTDYSTQDLMFKLKM